MALENSDPISSCIRASSATSTFPSKPPPSRPAGRSSRVPAIALASSQRSKKLSSDSRAAIDARRPAVFSKPYEAKIRSSSCHARGV